jgi:hypothetical protein
MILLPQAGTPHDALIASLFIQAIREGQSLWFRVASSSMRPLMRVNDHIFIQPAQANDISIGEIAAFETSSGLVIHRIIHRQHTGETLALFQMSDVDLHPTWVEQIAVVGKVTRVKSQNRQVDLLHPIAKWCGTVTARIRYQFYLYNNNVFKRTVLRVCSRLAVRLGYWCIRCCCSSTVTGE